MANTLKRARATGITTQANVLTAGAGETLTLVSIRIVNKTSSQVTFSVYNDTYAIQYNTPLPAGGAFDCCAGGVKVVMEATDELDVASDGAVDVLVGYLEQT